MSKHNFIPKALLLIAYLMPHFAVWGQVAGSEFWTGDLKYRVLQNEQEVEVIGLNYRYGVYEIQIPSIVTSTDWNETYTVTKIGDKAFSGCYYLTSIHIPNSVTTIGDDAFYNCYDLTSITVDSDNTNYSSSNGVLFDKAQQLLIQCPEGKYGVYQIPNSVTTIGDSAFWKCRGLTSINLSNSVTTIGNDAFEDCKKLKSITVDSGNTNYSSSDGVLFDKAQQLLIQYPEGKYGVYQIPNSVTTIGNYAFSGCSGLESIHIPNSVTTIGNYAFDSSGLTSINLPNSVTTIGDFAFLDCCRLTSIHISNSVTTIGYGAFWFCSGLESIHIPNSVTTIGDYAFSGCSGLNNITVDSDNTNYSSSDGVLFDKAQQLLIQCPARKQGVYQIPNSVTTIGGYAFYSCSGLTSIHIPNSVMTIGISAFNSCSGLTSVNLPNSVTTIGNRAFWFCSGLTSIHISNSVTTIGNEAFSYCIGLTSINLPNSVTTIGNGAFSDCDGLTSIHIPNSVTTIGSYAFSDCSGLRSIHIPNSITTIGYGAFCYCSGLESIHIPNSVTTIGDLAFYECSGLESIHIPNSVTTIGKSAFSLCRGLETLYFHSINPPTITGKSFGSDFHPQTIYVPQEAVATYQATEPYNRYNIKGMDESTGIGGVETTEIPQSGNIYDFNGRLVRTDGNLQALPKGIYILNGKKVVR